ncbi:MAG TPA: gliding motility-associated C-terminal domain-containing protein [Chitinophagaceae bacterium]|nr:gliding motility-associated C-terminal domain-containing protein [Chitinophagaceae bacterium]
MRLSILLLFLLLSISLYSQSQYCKGSLGDPIVNISFGTAHNPIPKTATTLRYVGGCPYDTGTYTIENFIVGCGENSSAKSWHPLIGDHTGDVKGQFMLVNASWALGVTHDPVIIYRDTAKNLCGNSNYVYSAWLANVMRNYACGGNPQLPNITFTVTSLSGVILTTANTGDLPIEQIGRVWREYGLSFTTPPNIDAVVLTLSIDPKRGCGNAFVVDDITFRMCGVNAIATIDGKTEPAKVCADYLNPFILNATYSAGFTDPVVQWQSSLDSGKTWKDIPGAVSITYAIPHRGPGVVLYRMAVAERSNINSLNCRILSNVIYTSVNPMAEHHAPQYMLGCLGKDLSLPQSDPTALSILWSGPNGYSSTLDKSIVPNVKYADTGLYTLQQTFYFGCVSLDTFYLKVYPATTISAQPAYSVCEGKNVTLSASGDGTFFWTPSTGLSNNNIANPVASLHDSIQYKVIVTNSYGCKDSALVNVNVFRNPKVNAGTDKTIIRGDTLQLNGTVTGTAVNFLWSPPTFMNNSQSLNPTVAPQLDITYTLSAHSTVGCGNADASIKIKVYNDIYLPTAFTPNGDGKNDRFMVIAADGYKLIQFQVYNRWGAVVYDAKDFTNGWDGIYKGLPQPSDVYTYYLEVSSKKNKILTKKGVVTLLR